MARPVWGRAARSPSPSKRSPYELPLTLREIAFGTTKAVTIQARNPERITVKIPSDDRGKKLRLAGKGTRGPGDPATYTFSGPVDDLQRRGRI
jgi:hypothetical protein